MPRLLLILVFFAICKSGGAQDKSNRGKEFWLGYGYNYKFLNEPPLNDQELAIYISTELSATVTVTINSTGYTQTLNIPANSVDASILIPKSGVNDARVLTDGLSTKGIHIVSTVPVAVYAHCYGVQVSGATMLMPVDTYGYLYYSINYSQASSGSSLPAINPNTQNGPDWYSWFYVIAAEDNTRVEITPSDSTKNGWLPNQTYTVNLNKGEMYNVFGKLNPNSTLAYAASKDMTGSRILSVTGADGKCHPVAVFSGSAGIRICRGDGGEFVHQQVFPAQAWGTRYLTYHTINNANTDINETNRNYYRVCVQDPTTAVRRNGTLLSGLTNNFYYEFMDSTGGDYITSDKPILVAQYTVNKNQCWRFPTTTPAPPSYGDPEMFYLSPIEQGQKSVLFYVSRKSTIDYVYANIHFPTNAVNSLLVDGVAVPAANIRVHPNLPSYSVAVVRFIGAANQHRIICDSTFTATVYGLGVYESYGYNTGTLINNLNALPNIANTLNTNGRPDTFTCPQSPTRLFVRVAYRATSLNWKLSQAGGGLFPNTDSIITNPVIADSNLLNGRRYYNYSLQQDFTFTTPGTYYIPVIYTAPDIDNCNHTDTARIQVVVKPGPVSDFTFNTVLCVQDTVRFTGAAVAGNFTLDRYRWTFDDGTTANTVNTIKRFATAGNHDITYRVIADNGCIDDTTKTISFLGSPIAKFGYDHNICMGDSIKFTDSSTIAVGTIATWKWNFGDGSSATYNNGNPFYYRYTTAGSHMVSLVAASASGCSSDTFRLPVMVSPKPVAKFGILFSNICLGDSIRISDSSTIAQGTITNWQWNFGDGTTVNYANGNPFFHRYQLPGNYTVSLVVSPTNGCLSDTFKLPVSVGVKPVAKFGISSNRICQRDSLQISDSSIIASGTITTWKWNFGDGSTAIYTNNAPFKHPYNLPGTYMISLVTVPLVGCLSDTFRLSITVTPKPKAKFGYDRNICAGDSIKFSDSSSFPQGSILNWKWNFGDGNSVIKTNSNPFYHTYTTSGVLPVTLVTEPTTGCTDTFTLNVTISQKPVASFTYSGSPCKDSTFIFTSTSSGNGGALQSWYWDFGNGQIVTATNNNPIPVTYNTISNNITVKHVAGINSGCISDTAVLQPLVIHPNPTAAFTITGDTVCQNIPLLFTSQSNPADSINRWAWSLGDGSVASVNPISKSFAQARVYNVQLVTKNKFGCGSLPAINLVTINKLPVVDAGPSFTVPSGTLIRFNPTVNDSILFSFRWEPAFTGISRPDTLRPTLMVLQNQTFTLTATGPGNCTAMDTMQVKVLSLLTVTNAFSPNGDGINDVWMVPGLADYPQATVQIFDRYGRVVFNTTGYTKPWDGKLNGNPLPTGTYYYIIQTKTEFVKPFSGTVTILR